MIVDAKPLVSVIVPVYNAEKYLKRCVESILQQTMEDFELILVNDGSNDFSGEMCDSYAITDSRVRVFHKENGGVSSARNVGIENALGVYSIQVDSDDYISSEMLECLHAKIIKNDSDIIICDYFLDNGKNKKIITQGNFKSNIELISMLLTGELHGSMGNKLIRTSLYDKYSIRFPEDLSLREDMYVCMSLFIHEIKVDYLNKAFYFYCQNTNSLSSQLGEKQIKNNLISAKKIISLINCNPNFSNQIISFKLKIRMNVFVLSDNGQKIKYLFPETNKYIFKDKKLPVWVKLGMVSVVWGLGLTACCLLAIRRRLG